MKGSAGERVEDPPVVLLHSLGLGAAAWNQVVAALAPARRLVVPDLRGHGGGGWDGRPFQLGDLAGDLRSLLDGLGAGAVDLVGLSLGGNVAALFAARHPDRVRGVVLADCTAWYGPEGSALWERRARSFEEMSDQELLEVQLDRWFSPRFRAGQPAEVARLGRLLLANDRPALAAHCRALASLDLRGELAGIAAPAVVIGAEGDVAVPVEMVSALAAAIPNAELRLVPEAGHLSLLEQPGLVPEALERLSLRALAGPAAMRAAE